ncbi:MAG: hypothetical protein M3Y87_29230, partial [Myxococcota bacterium]|nr:hypothetical protein [Myxococcota bacterium]
MTDPAQRATDVARNTEVVTRSILFVALLVGSCAAPHASRDGGARHDGGARASADAALAPVDAMLDARLGDAGGGT